MKLNSYNILNYELCICVFPVIDETITDDDADANDPEFNYFAEAEREKPDAEDFRVDKFTQIPSKYFIFKQLLTSG